jgi:hypothetical protein
MECAPGSNTSQDKSRKLTDLELSASTRCRKGLWPVAKPSGLAFTVTGDRGTPVSRLRPQSGRTSNDADVSLSSVFNRLRRKTNGSEE